MHSLKLQKGWANYFYSSTKPLHPTGAHLQEPREFAQPTFFQEQKCTFGPPLVLVALLRAALPETGTCTHYTTTSRGWIQVCPLDSISINIWTQSSCSRNSQVVNHPSSLQFKYFLTSAFKWELMHPARQGRWLRIEILYLEEPRFISLMKGSHEIFANMNLLNLVKKTIRSCFYDTP